MKALIVGLGRMGRFHHRALTELGYDVVSVDPDPQAGADHLRIPDHYRFQVVCVATPIQHLAEQAAWWIGHCEALLIEKPMAATLEEGQELARELRAQPTAVGYVERFNPRLQDLKRAINGRPVVAATFKRWNTRPTCDINLDLRSHDIDLAHYLNVHVPSYDTCAGMPRVVRQVSALTGGEMLTVDLLDHATSPLHAQWRDLLDGGGEAATPQDAITVLHELQPTALPLAA